MSVKIGQGWNGIKERLLGALVFRHGGKIKIRMQRVLAIVAVPAVGILLFSLGRVVGLRPAESVAEKSSEQSGFAGEVVRLLKKSLNGMASNDSVRSGPKSGKGSRKSRGIAVISTTDLSMVEEGAMVSGILLTSASDSRVVALIEEPIPLKNSRSHPGGIRLFGRGTIRNDRLMIEFDRAIEATGQTHKIKAHAFDPESLREGLAGDKYQRWLVRFVGTLGLKLTEALIEEWSRSARSNQPQDIQQLAEEALRRGGKLTAAEEGQAGLNSALESTANIDISGGTPIMIMFEANHEDQ
jgi:hypothetical protein